MLYYIEAKNDEDAKRILLEKGGWEIKGELLIDGQDYFDAHLVDDQ